MRTVILIGAILIASAIKENVINKKGASFLALITIIAMFMDLIEFIIMSFKK